jgi:hypothetical protein
MSVSRRPNQRRDKSAISFEPSNPHTRVIFIARAISHKENASRPVDFKIQIPPEISLARLVVCFDAPLTQLLDQPFRKIIPKTAGIDEIALLFGRIEGLAVKRDDRPDW